MYHMYRMCEANIIMEVPRKYQFKHFCNTWPQGYFHFNIYKAPAFDWIFWSSDIFFSPTSTYLVCQSIHRRTEIFPVIHLPVIWHEYEANYSNLTH